jgi:nitroreductase
MKKALVIIAAAAMICAPATVFAQSAQKVIKLMEPTYNKGLTLMEALKERKSSSGFTEKEISLQNLSNIIWASVGVNRPDGRRTSPTGSNRQEIEVYAFFKTGVYYYNYKNNTLELVKEGDYRSITGRRDAQEAYLDLLFIADTDKTGPGEKEGEAATVSYVDVGYVSQNVYLACANAGIGSRARGGWDQKKVVETLGLKPAMIVVLGQTVGYCDPSRSNENMPPRPQK